MKLKNKSLLVVIGLFVLVLLVAYTYEYLMYLNTSIACGKFYKRTEVKGSKYIHYRVTIDNKVRYGSTWVGDLRVKDLDSLKNFNCIQIEYSNYSNFFNRVIDKRILK